jgi:hypothetical protein
MTASKTYTFEHNGKKFTIPAMNALPMGVLRKSRKAADEMDRAFMILEELMGENSPELKAVDSMDADAFNEFLTGWTQGAPLGESSSSES